VILLIAVAGASSCRGETPGGEEGPAGGAARVLATVARPQMDTVRFNATAATHHCQAGRSLLIESVADGNGLLVWLRPGGGDVAGDYDVLGVRDTVTPRGAIVAVRYMTGDVAHGFSLDSGAVQVEAAAGSHRWRMQVHGSGLETTGALREHLAAELTGLGPPSPGDATSCASQA